MLLAIVQNPHVKNPRELIKRLEPEEIRDRPEQLDVTALENFKRNLDRKSGIGIK